MALPSPRLCCNAIFALGTCRFPASPRICQHSSAHCARPVAPSGWPFDSNPPDGLTTTFPPYVLSPASINGPAPPSGQSCNASYVTSSFAVKQSCSSTTSTSSAVTFAFYQIKTNRPHGLFQLYNFS